VRPTSGGLLAALVAAGFGTGLVLLANWLRSDGASSVHPPGRISSSLRALGSVSVGGRVSAAVLAGLGALVVTRWPVAALGVAALVVAWPAMFGGARAERSRIVALEALVIWTEALRDTVVAHAGLEEAIPVTAAHSSATIRPALVRLAGRLQARVPLDTALLELSAELHDGSADKVIGALVLNARRRGSGLAEVLSSLAAASRAELDQRRRISAGRASMRRSVQLVVLITVGFAGSLATFSRPYVAPYSGPAGQLALVVVVGLFGASFTWMRRLADGEGTTPFLVRSDPRVADAERRIVHHLTVSPVSIAAPVASSAGKPAAATA
jgi:hypothetical protein